MAAELRSLPGPGSGRGPGGPDDPGSSLERRVAAVEARLDRIDAKVDRIDEALRRLEPAIREVSLRFSDLNARIASVEGQVKALPSSLQLFLALITTWSAGTAVVFALLKAIH